MYIFVSLRGEIMRICKSNCKNNPTSDCVCFYIECLINLGKKNYILFFILLYILFYCFL
jgi:hypothetical protein